MIQPQSKAWAALLVAALDFGQFATSAYAILMNGIEELRLFSNRSRWAQWIALEIDMSQPRPQPPRVMEADAGGTDFEGMGLFQRTARRACNLSMGVALGLICMFLSAPARSADPEVVPQTKLRVSVFQWMPTKGVYEQWEALSGEFIVTQDGALELPVVGSVPVAGLSGSSIAAAVATRLREKIGLVEEPETTVEVVEYPPIYVVGDVATPGEYRFRAGLTALQALALGGGVYRSEETTGRRSNDEIRLAGELEGISTDIIRTKARIARLTAEMSGASEVQFPPVVAGSADGTVTADIYARERVIFLARAKEVDRQTKSLSDLRELLNAEIEVLQEKIKTADGRIKSAEDELVGVSQLVEKGIALASRKTDLEYALAGYRTDRLDQVTAIMRARQGVSEATRNMVGLQDKQQTAVATELQQEEANLAQLLLKQQISQKLLFKALGSTADSSDPQQDPAVGFTIVRREGGEPSEVSAVESTALLPGDVVKVRVTSPEIDSASRSIGSISTASDKSKAVSN